MKKKVYLKRVKSKYGSLCSTKDKDCYFKYGAKCKRPSLIVCKWGKVFIQVPDPLQELWDWCEKKYNENNSFDVHGAAYRIALGDIQNEIEGKWKE